MNRINLKKLLILNIPYILVGLFATNLGEAWRLAEGADSSAKILSFFYVLPVASKNDVKNINVWIYKKKIFIKTNSRSSAMRYKIHMVSRRK